MAVYTPIDASAMRELVARYDGPGAFVSYAPILGGVTNTNFRVTCERGEAVLTVVEDGTSAKDAAFFARAMEAAAASNVPAPRPYPLISGGYVAEIYGKPAFLCAFLPGESPKRPGNAHLYALGETLAAFHLGAAGITDDKENLWNIQRCRAFFEERRRDVEKAYPRAASLLEEEFCYLASHDFSFLPKGIVHGDVFPDNTLFEGTRLAGVIDFFYACRETLLYDLGVCLNAWCFEREDCAFNFTKASFFLRGYHAGRPLSVDEERYLPYFCRLTALRFLTSRLEAALRDSRQGALVAHRDPEEYCRRLAFHRSVKGDRPYAAISAA
ncbi:MAG: homoserine kinase [Rickettsiales bacterium]